MYRRIRDMREDHDLYQRDLAEYLQCSQVCCITPAQTICSPGRTTPGPIRLPPDNTGPAGPGNEITPSPPADREEDGVAFCRFPLSTPPRRGQRPRRPADRAAPCPGRDHTSPIWCTQTGPRDSSSPGPGWRRPPGCRCGQSGSKTRCLPPRSRHRCPSHPPE